MTERILRFHSIVPWIKLKMSKKYFWDRMMGSKMTKILTKLGPKKCQMRQQGLKEQKLRECLKKKQWGQMHQLNLQRHREWQKRQRGFVELQHHNKMEMKRLRKKE